MSTDSNSSEPLDTITWRELLAQTSAHLADRTVARWLCEHASGFDAEEFIAVLDDTVSARAGIHLDAMVRRLMSGEPLQYVMARWAFRRLDLMVDRRVLIPRPETEQLVDLALAHLSTIDRIPRVVVDLGTGSGAIGLSIVSESPLGSMRVHMTDASIDALDVARANCAGLGRSASQVVLHHGSWFDALPHELRGSCDVIVSNPPYIAVGDAEVEKIVRDWEPAEALFSGDDGLSDVREIVAGAREWLLPGGVLLVEIGHSQGDPVKSLFERAGFVESEVLHDLSGRTRFARGYSPR